MRFFCYYERKLSPFSIEQDFALGETVLLRKSAGRQEKKQKGADGFEIGNDCL